MKVKQPVFPGCPLARALKGVPKDVGIKRAHKLVWFFHEKTVSSGLGALIPYPRVHN
jgi:hypothetical protein